MQKRDLLQEHFLHYFHVLEAGIDTEEKSATVIYC